MPKPTATATAAVIKALARNTSACDVHGQVEAVRPHEARVIDRGHYMAVAAYAVTFADGLTRSYWMRGVLPVEVR